jgi:microcystin degradation protein MlrC
MLSDGRYVKEGRMGGGSHASYGRTAVLVCEGVEIVITEQRHQPYDTGFPRSLGIEPTQRKLIVIKSAVHFRGTYQDIAEKIFDADTPGVHRPDFALMKHRYIRRPIYPLDKSAEFAG